jgi:hypothetical protein
MLQLAAERLGADAALLDQDALWLNYQPDVDMLAIRFVEHPHPTHSKDDQTRGAIFNYADSNLVSIELLNLYGVFVT